MRCLSCKYDLRQLTEHRCPECGRAFDPQEPTTFDGNARDTFPLKLGCILLCILPLVYIYSFLSTLYPLEPGERESGQRLMAHFMAFGATVLISFLLTPVFLLILAIRKTFYLCRKSSQSFNRSATIPDR